MFNLSARPNVQIGIQMASFCKQASNNEVSLAAIRAVDEVESAGSGFLLSSKRPKILFEGHFFYKFLGRLGLAEKARKIDPTICYPTWTKQFYKGRDREYERIAAATEMCHKFDVSDSLALRSASWGRYQVMGDNFHDAGFDSVEDFIEAIFDNEENHLIAFISYVKNAFLIDELQNLSKNIALYSARFASGYNGSGYRRNHYDIKIGSAFRRFAAQNYDCSRVVADIHVVAAMPGLRNPDPGTEGVENTSLDDRYIDLSHQDSDGVYSMPENQAPEGKKSDQVADHPTGAEKISDQANENDAVSEEAPKSQIQVAGGDINSSSQATIDAAKSLPDTVVETKSSTGLLKKIGAVITAILTGQYIIPDFIRDGFSKLDLANIFSRVFEGLFSFRYIIIGSLLVYFVMHQIKDLFLKAEQIKINTDPAKGNIQLVPPPAEPSLLERVRNLF